MRRSDSAGLRRSPITPAEQDDFDAEIDAHDRVERRLLWKEMVALVVVGVFVVIRQLWLD